MAFIKRQEFTNKENPPINHKLEINHPRKAHFKRENKEWYLQTYKCVFVLTQGTHTHPHIHTLKGTNKTYVHTSYKQTYIYII